MDIMCADYYFWYHVSTLVQEVSSTHVRMLGNKEKYILLVVSSIRA